MSCHLTITRKFTCLNIFQTFTCTTHFAIRCGIPKENEWPLHQDDRKEPCLVKQEVEWDGHEFKVFPRLQSKFKASLGSLMSS